MRRTWSPAAEEKLARLYRAGAPLSRIAFQLKRTEKAVRSRARLLRITRGTRQPWTKAEDRELRRRYPKESTQVIAASMGCSVGRIYNRAAKLGLFKSREWLSRSASERWAAGLQEASRRGHFKPGQVPPNKGKKGVTGTHPNCRRTQFKKGHLGGRAAEVQQPVGAERLSKEGYLERKIHNGMPFQSRWRAVHLIRWEAINGPIPAGHALVFRDRNKANTDPANMELVTRAELMRRNSLHTLFPPEARQLIQLRAALNRKINNRTKTP